MRLLQFCELTREDWRKLKNATSTSPFVLTTEPTILLTVAGARAAKNISLAPTEEKNGKGLRCYICKKTQGFAGNPFDKRALKLHMLKAHGKRKAKNAAKGGE